jgi:hypothetical protein
MEAAITFLQSNERIDEHVHVCYGCSLQTRNILNAAGGGLVVVSKYFDVGLFQGTERRALCIHVPDSTKH